jgi:selenocysteine lyase/cysteine desulfurase
MIFAMNGTDALNMAIKGVLGDGDAHGQVAHVITTVLEHNSVSRPLQAMADAGTIELMRIDCDEDGFVDPEDVRRAIRPATRMIVMTHGSNVLGTVQDAGAVGRIAREHEVLFCLDAAQTAGIIPVSIADLHVDLLAFPGHKSLLGPTGTGGLYVGSRCPEPAEAVAATRDEGQAAGPAGTAVARAARLRPWREGGTGGDSSTPTQPVLYPYYLEGGTPNTVGIAGLNAAVDYIVAHDMDQTLAHEQKMVQHIIDRFSEDDRFTIYGTKDATRRVGAVALNIAGYEPSDVGSILDDSFDIAVRPGLHCAPYAHKRLGTFPAGAVRISPGPFNTPEQLESLCDALEQIAG